MASLDFETVFPDRASDLLRDAHEAITACGLWEWLKTYEPEDGIGFMFGEHPNLDKISAAMKFRGHTGFTYAWTMAVMHAISREGWDAYRERVLPRRNPCPCRHKQGYTDGWCGVAGGGVPACDH